MKQLLFILIVLCRNTNFMKAENISEFKYITLQICPNEVGISHKIQNYLIL